MSQCSSVMMDGRRGETNALGVAAFVCSLVGLFTGGMLSPVGLILSLFALGKHPRGFAVAGLILGMLGSGCLTGMFVMGLLGMVAAALGLATVVGVTVLEPRMAASRDMAELEGAVRAYYDRQKALPEHLGVLVPEFYSPSASSGRAALVDPWKKPYRYEAAADGSGFRIWTDGPDGRTGTGDDAWVEGKVDGVYVPETTGVEKERGRGRTF